MDFFGCLLLHGIFPRENRGFKEFRGFPDMELGTFGVAKSSGEGRGFRSSLVVPSSMQPAVIYLCLASLPREVRALTTLTIPFANNNKQQ